MSCFKYKYILRSWVSSEGEMTRLRTGCLKNLSSIPDGEQENFLLFIVSRPNLRDHLAPYAGHSVDSLKRVKRTGRETNHSSLASDKELYLHSPTVHHVIVLN